MATRIVGEGLQEIARDPDISRAMFDILEAQFVQIRVSPHPCPSV